MIVNLHERNGGLAGVLEREGLLEAEPLIEVTGFRKVVDAKRYVRDSV